MITLNGKNGSAKVFIDSLDNETISQVIGIMNHPVSEGSNVAIMSDCHAGKGCVVGTTMTIKDRLVPNIVGVDIGCGMFATCLGQIQHDNDFLKKFDKIVHEVIPCGKNKRTTPHHYAKNVRFNELRMKGAEVQGAILSTGTLGGGNHFIELNIDSSNNVWLVIHSGSRHLGLEIANYYQKAAENEIRSNGKQELIAKLKAEKRDKDIASEIAKLPKIGHDEAFLARGNSGFEDYLNDMAIAQEFASWNRKAMAQSILNELDMVQTTAFETVHNYIDIASGIVRKGAVSAQKGEKLLIPMNMQYGSLLCIGKGNSDWNFSAPHGAGRTMSRSKAKLQIKLDEFQEAMKGVYSSTVNQSTLDEAPMAYKNPQDIIGAIGETVEVIDTLKPIYNFKASE